MYVACVRIWGLSPEKTKNYLSWTVRWTAWKQRKESSIYIDEYNDASSIFLKTKKRETLLKDEIQLLLYEITFKTLNLIRLRLLMWVWASI